MSEPQAPAAPVAIQDIPIDQLKPNPWNRTVFDPDALEELAASLKAVGVKEPLIVRPLTLSIEGRKGEGDQYQIVSGHRRYLAAQKAGLKEVPCLAQDLSDQAVSEMNIVANIQREDVPPLQLAGMVKTYIDQFQVNQDQAADQFGKSRPWVTQLLGFLSLAPEVLNNVTAVTLGFRPLRALKTLPTAYQAQVAKELAEGSLKPDKVEKRCNQLRFLMGESGISSKKASGNAAPHPAPSPSMGEGGGIRA